MYVQKKKRKKKIKPAFLTCFGSKAARGGKCPQLQLVKNFPDRWFRLHTGTGPLWSLSPAATAAAPLRWVQPHPHSSSFCISSSACALPLLSLPALTSCQDQGRRVDQSQSPLAPKTVWDQQDLSLLQKKKVFNLILFFPLKFNHL